MKKARRPRLKSKGIAEAIIAILLAAGAILLYWLSTRGEYAVMLHQLSVLLLYPAGVLLLVVVFSQLQEQKGKGKEKELDQGLLQQEKAAETDPRQLLQTIEHKSVTIERQGKFQSLIVLTWVYLALQGALIAGLLLAMSKIGLPVTEGYFKYGYFHAIILIIMGVAAFVAVRLLMISSEKEAHRTAKDLLCLIGSIMFVCAFVVVLRVMYGFVLTGPVFYFCRGAAIFFALAMSLALVIRGILGQLLTNFSYTLLPLNSGKQEEGFLDSLESQTGISLKSLWSIGYIGKILPAAVLSVFGLLLIATMFFIVSPQEQGLVYRLGVLDQEAVADPGIHFKLPWPIEIVELYDVSRIKNFQVGYHAGDAQNFLWTQSHDGDEYTFLTGNGTELVSVNIKVMYRIEDLQGFITRSCDPESLLSAKAYELMMKRMITRTLDQFLSVDRARLSKDLEKELNAFSQSVGMGIQVVGTTIESIHPPIQIADVYQGVVNASVKKKTMTINARTQANKTLMEAEKESSSSRINAEAEQNRRISEAEYEMAIYYAAFEAHKRAPESFELYRYLETFEKTIASNKVYVFTSGTGDDLSHYVFGNNGQEVIVPGVMNRSEGNE